MENNKKEVLVTEIRKRTLNKEIVRTYIPGRGGSIQITTEDQIDIRVISDKPIIYKRDKNNKDITLTEKEWIDEYFNKKTNKCIVKDIIFEYESTTSGCHYNGPIKLELCIDESINIIMKSSFGKFMFYSSIV